MLYYLLTDYDVFNYNYNYKSLEDSILSNFGGPVINNLIHRLGNLDDLSVDTEIPSHANYVDTLSLECKLPSSKEKCTVKHTEH